MTTAKTRRPWTIVLVLAVAATGLLALRPGGTTLAAWSDEVGVELPALTTGGIGLSVTPAGATRASITVDGDVDGTWRPTAVEVRADGRPLTGAELAGSRLEYRLENPGGQCPPGGAVRYTAEPSGGATSFPVSGPDRLAGARTLCLTLVPSDQVRIEHGGHSLTITTTVDGTAAPATWTAAGSWTAAHPMPPGPSVSGPTCTSGPGSAVTVGWEWDRAGLSQDVQQWRVEMRAGSQWSEFRSMTPGGSTTAEIRPSQFGWFEWQGYDVRVVAVLADGTTIPSGETRIRVERFLFGQVYCA